MATAFSRTLRSLRNDGFRSTFAALALALTILGAWVTWMTWSRVTLYEVTDQARLEVANAIHPVQAPIAGRIVVAALTIGRRVKEGDVLVQLDTEPQLLQIREADARMMALEAEIRAYRAQADAEEHVRIEEQSAARLAAEQARSQEREAAAPARFSETDMTRLTALHAQGLISERDYAAGQAEAAKRSAILDGSRTAVAKVEQEQRTRDSERDARLRRLQADIVRLEGEALTLRRSIERSRYEVERRVVRAPATGRLGEVKTLAPGSVVAEGERLAAIVPDEALRVVASFTPSTAIGRLRPGQLARMRMHGFPWAQHGTVEATVRRVADEIRDGVVRVELDVQSAPARLPLQHGMSGSIEVEVERISPAALLLRLAGERLTEGRARS